MELTVQMRFGPVKTSIDYIMPVAFLFLCDADFVLETEQHILLIEYKNAKIKEALLHVETEKQRLKKHYCM